MCKKLEIADIGMANGIASEEPLTDEQKQKMIERAAEKFGEFLDELECDWRNDPNSNDTPRRVAKAYVNNLWAGRYNGPPSITGFPSDGYDGMVFEGGIPLTSMCSHHHQTINGKVHIGYISSGHVIGLSKMHRIVNHFAKRPQVQERMTVQIFNELQNVLDTKDVGLLIDADHLCVASRGIKDITSSTITFESGGEFKDDQKWSEFLSLINTEK